MATSDPGERIDDATGGASSCQNCGSHVSLRFTKVFGDNDDIVHACFHCSPHYELFEWRRGNG